MGHKGLGIPYPAPPQIMSYTSINVWSAPIKAALDMEIAERFYSRLSLLPWISLRIVCRLGRQRFHRLLPIARLLDALMSTAALVVVLLATWVGVSTFAASISLPIMITVVLLLVVRLGSFMRTIAVLNTLSMTLLAIGSDQPFSGCSPSVSRLP